MEHLDDNVTEEHNNALTTLFDGRGFGLIKGNFQKIYAKAKERGKRIAIVKNYLEKPDYTKLSKIFDQIYNSMTSPEIDLESSYRTKEVLDYYLKIHKTFPINQSKNEDISKAFENLKLKKFKFADVIFVELTTDLSHEAEYLIMMHTYLLNLGFQLPEFYPIIDYHAEIFDFIETDIFRYGWDKKFIKPIPNFLEERKSKKFDLFDVTIYQTTFSSSRLQFIVSESDIFKSFKDILANENYIPPYENYEEYKKSAKFENTSSNETIIVKFKTFEELMKLKDIKADIIILDSRVKIPVNFHYAGNIPTQRKISDDYLSDRVYKIGQKSTNCKILVYKVGNNAAEKYEENQVCTRGIFTRSPIIDYIYFKQHKVDLLHLYSNYISMNSVSGFINILKFEISNLEYYGFYENPASFNICVKTKIHPLMISFINKWFSMKNKKGDPFPKFSILLFVAVVTTFNKNYTNVVEHGTREREELNETSLYFLEMSSYISKMEDNQRCIYEGGGKASDRLRILIEHYDISSEQIKKFNIQEFTTFLIYMIENYYDKLLLTNIGGSRYKGSSNEQLVWTIDGSSCPAKILPIIVYSSNKNRKVILYLPIENPLKK